MFFKHRQRGFTLIELLVVVSIIGMLSSLVTASVIAARDRGRVAGALIFDTANYRAHGDDNMLYIPFQEGTGLPINQSAYASTISIYNCPGASCTAEWSSQNDAPSGRGFSYVFNESTFPVKSFIKARFSQFIQLRDFTVSAWVKPSSQSPMGGLSRPMVTGFNCEGISSTDLCIQTPNRRVFRIAFNLDGAIVFGYMTPEVARPLNIPAGKWSHIAFSYSGLASQGGTNKYILYLDGKAVYEVSGPDTAPFSGLVDLITIGGIWGDAFPGNIDNPAVYLHALGN